MFFQREFFHIAPFKQFFMNENVFVSSEINMNKTKPTTTTTKIISATETCVTFGAHGPLGRICDQQNE